ncbi:MAG: c-type cytochrome biogenesis protein CcmI [Pseudomonadota bacterium]
MTITFLTILVLLVVLAAILRPLLRQERAPDAGASAEIGVYREQLDELVREQEQGLIGADEAAAAKVEIERRLLAAGRRAAEETKPAIAGRRPLTAALTAGGILVVTGALYLGLGNPDVPDQPFAQRQAEREQLRAQAGDLESRIADVEARLEENPEDADQWWILAQSYNAMGRYDQAIEALQQVLRLSGNNPAVLGTYGETVIRANGNAVTAPARLAFQQVLEARPQDPRARYYLALADAQDENYEAALERWLDLYNDSRPDAPWRSIVEEHLVEMARLTGRDVEEVLPGATTEGGFEAIIATARRQMADGNAAGARATLAAAEERFAAAPFVLMQIRQTAAQLGLAPPATSTATSDRGPSDADVAAAAELTDEERLDMIRGMVGGLAARLESEPDDLEGWLMLMRSHVVLGDPVEAESVMRDARDAFEGNAEALGAIGVTAQNLGLAVR